MNVEHSRHAHAPLLGVGCELVTQFSAEGTPTRTVARAPTTRGSEVLFDDMPAPLRRLVRSAERECGRFRITASAVEAELPSPLPDPRRASALWRTLSRIALALDRHDA